MIWSYFIHIHIRPLLIDLHIDWNRISIPRFYPVFFKHSQSIHLYKWEDKSLTMYKLQNGANSRWKAIYLNVPYMVDLTFDQHAFNAVDVQLSTKGLSIVGDWCGKIINQTQIHPPSLETSFLQLHPALRETCGTVCFPSDNGRSLMEEITNSNGNVFGASDAPLKYVRATHAWIISSGKVDDLNNPLLHISGGPAHRISHSLSLARGELQGVVTDSNKRRKADRNKRKKRHK